MPFLPRAEFACRALGARYAEARRHWMCQRLPVNVGIALLLMLLTLHKGAGQNAERRSQGPPVNLKVKLYHLTTDEHEYYRIAPRVIDA